ncbi:MAG: hypothetical protein JW863_05700 [Chitinispirillaceae bacterium]|nr:hypothetical protein [Chitinispirillaceae bacterium]
MKIGIVVYSQSGITAKVARTLATALTAKGHDIDITLLRTIGKLKPRSTDFEIKNAPSVDEFDALVVAGPVWAFTICPVILKYVRGLGKLSGKKVLCYVTKGLPFSWTGGTRALKEIEAELSLSDASVFPGEMILRAKTGNDATLRPYIDRMVGALCG